MRAFLVGATFTALAVAGCSNNDSSTPDIADPDDQMDQGDEPTDPVDPPTEEELARDNDELAQVLGAHVRGEFGIQLVAFEISKGRFPEGFAQTGVSDTLEATGTGALGGMTYAFTYHCNADDTAHTVVACDGNAGHSHMLWTMSGSETVGAMAMNDMSRTVDWEIRDLMFDKARFRGPDNVAVSSSVTTNGEVSTYTLNMDAVYEKVRYLAGAVIPTFGTIDFNVNVERVRGDDRRVFETTAHLVYGASGVPTVLTIAGSLNYTIDLASGAVVKQ
jgi:hypothetical protein